LVLSEIYLYLCGVIMKYIMHTPIIKQFSEILIRCFSISTWRCIINTNYRTGFRFSPHTYRFPGRELSADNLCTRSSKSSEIAIKSIDVQNLALGENYQRVLHIVSNDKDKTSIPCRIGTLVNCSL